MSDDANELSSLRPYLLRAHHEWMSDNGLTPHLVVNAQRPGVAVPTQFVKDGTIVLNIALRAVRDLMLDNDAISFNARFSGVSHQVYVPIDAVRGLVAREYGVGVTFADESFADEASTDEASVGNHADDDGIVRASGPTVVAVDDADDVGPDAGEAGDDDGGPDDGDRGPPPRSGRGKRPSLRVVK